MCFPLLLGAVGLQGVSSEFLPYTGCPLLFLEHGEDVVRGLMIH